jgi:tRNA nucleotidyltransferase/poly(A) polymerase
MADYIYTMETRLTPEQLHGVSLVQDIARDQEMNVYLTGGAVRDLISGLAIRDLDFTVQGNPIRLQDALVKAGASIEGVDDDLKVIYILLPGRVRAEVSMARSETYEKPGKLPVIAPATITEDLRRRDFTVNAMALSLNPGSRGLLLDPANGVADIEAKLIRILHNYAFYEEPSRLIRATRYAARFHWPLEERTQARYDAARENHYIEQISRRAVGAEIEQLAYEEDPLSVMRALEKEGWLPVLNHNWTLAKVDTNGLAQLIKCKQQMGELGYAFSSAASVLYVLAKRLPEKDIADMRRQMPRRDLVEGWQNLEEESKELVKLLSGKETALPSGAWRTLSAANPETILFTLVNTKQPAISQKINNFFGKWRLVKQKLPVPEMAEMRITPALPEYLHIADELFLLMLDGKAKTHNEIVKFLKPFSPPPPPPPPPAKRGRAAKAAGGKPGRKAKAGVAEIKAVATEAAAPAVVAVEKAPAKAASSTASAKKPEKAVENAKPVAAKPVAVKAAPAKTVKIEAKAAKPKAKAKEIKKAVAKKPVAKKPEKKTKPASQPKKAEKTAEKKKAKAEKRK